MKHVRPFPFYLILFLSIFLLMRCKATQSISVEEYKHNQEIRIIVMQDSSIYQVHSGQQIETFFKNDTLIFRQVNGEILTSVPVSEIDHLGVSSYTPDETESPSAGILILDAILEALLYLF